MKGRRFWIGAVMFLALATVGCSLVDTLIGTKHNADGTVEVTPGGGVAGAVATALGAGWITTLLGLGTTAYATYKGHGWKVATKKTVISIEDWKEDPANAEAWATLKPILEKNHATAGVVKLIEKAIG